MQHTIVTMSRGDAHKIVEWLTFHVGLGFSDFQIVLDGDIDGTGDLLRSLDVGAHITVHPRAEIGEYYDGLEADERRRRVLAWREKHAAKVASGEMKGVDALSWRQHLHLPEVMAPYAAGERGRGWLALIDVDEFLVLTEESRIEDLTAGVSDSRLGFTSFDVDTRGHDPSRPVLEQHSMRWSYDDMLAHPERKWSRRVKSMVRYRKAVLNHSVHKINRGPRRVWDWQAARLHHFKVPTSHDLGIPYSVHDPVRLPVSTDGPTT